MSEQSVGTAAPVAPPALEAAINDLERAVVHNMNRSTFADPAPFIARIVAAREAIVRAALARMEPPVPPPADPDPIVWTVGGVQMRASSMLEPRPKPRHCPACSMASTAGHVFHRGGEPCPRASTNSEVESGPSGGPSEESK